MVPELRHLDFVWTAAEGDLTGDGIPDVAMVLTGRKGGDAPMEVRLVVLGGSPGGGYRRLSGSGEFCHPSKFYGVIPWTRDFKLDPDSGYAMDSVWRAPVPRRTSCDAVGSLKRRRSDAGGMAPGRAP